MSVIIQNNISLKPYNTLNIDVLAHCFAEIASSNELVSVLGAHKFDSYLPLGGGSNVVFTQDYVGLVLFNKIKGIEIRNENDEFIELRVGGGEIWDELVSYAVAHSWYGIENLSAIPGSVGAAPVQNIGAYGVELKDVFIGLEYVDLKTGLVHSLDLDDCCFGYRDSIFKANLKDQCFITQVSIRLQKQASFKLGYGEIGQQLLNCGFDEQCLTLQQVRQAVVSVRANKLPDYNHLPNVGSFFKNPIVSQSAWGELMVRFPDMISYPFGDDCYKLAAGWLIDHLGWKGKEINGAVVHAKQALVLINKNSDGRGVLLLAKQIQDDVHRCFGVELEIEPRLI